MATKEPNLSPVPEGEQDDDLSWENEAFDEEGWTYPNLYHTE